MKFWQVDGCKRGSNSDHLIFNVQQLSLIHHHRLCFAQIPRVRRQGMVSEKMMMETHITDICSLHGASYYVQEKRGSSPSFGERNVEFCRASHTAAPMVVILTRCGQLLICQATAVNVSHQTPKSMLLLANMLFMLTRRLGLSARALLPHSHYIYNLTHFKASLFTRRELLGTIQGLRSGN